MRIFRAFQFIQGNEVKIGIHRPSIDISKKSMLSQIDQGKSYEFIYFVFPKDVEEIIPVKQFNKFQGITRKEFDKNPKIGIMIYKNKNNEKIFKKM